MKKEKQSEKKLYKNPLLYLTVILLLLSAGLWIYMEKVIPNGKKEAHSSLSDQKVSDQEISDSEESNSSEDSESLDPWIKNAEEMLEDFSGKPRTDTVLQPLESRIRVLMDIPGETWSVYLKDLNTDQEICIGDQPMYAASLIKLYVMEYWAEKIVSGTYDYQSELFPTEKELKSRLADMIERSDNDAFNELVQEISEDHSFESGCRILNEYLRENGYENTGIFHTLHPTYFSRITISEEENHTSVVDCGKLLDKIYRGQKEGDKAAELMIGWLLKQESTYKIPAGLPKGTKVANKTGETDTREQDVAIIYGPETDFVLCIMNSDVHEVGDAMDVIRSIAATSYYMLNPNEVITVDSRYYME